jgi:DNA recombination protein RmuC
MEWLPTIFSGLALLGVAAALVVLVRQRTDAVTVGAMRQELERLRNALGDESERLRQALANEARESTRSYDNSIRSFSLELTGRIAQDIGKARETQYRSAQELQKQVQDKLDHIRGAVEEKLQATLEARLGASFKQVSERLEQVYKGLGEMQALATGVGDLKRVLTNVRTRGTFGEGQLQQLLEQVLVPSQYDKNVATIPGSAERVEFAVRLPGDEDGKPVYLPIDAKFPVEDYERLIAAHAAGDSSGIEDAGKALRRRILDEAAKIRKKYVAPPHTTDIALLFLPTEGLFAEILRYPGVLDELQALKIVPCGPSTLFITLNSLQMGFRTLALQKRSHEVWQVLGAVKSEFVKFGDTLSKVKEKLDQASKKIAETEVRSRAMQRVLRDVESLPGASEQAPPLLPD